MDKKYGKEFYIKYKGGSYESARRILPYVFKAINPESIIDFGCGIGTWLSVAKELNSNLKICGIDGEYVDKSMLMIESKEFIPCDLTKPLKLEEKYDLAVSLEVAEHINDKSEQIFINNICNTADVVLFSAAVPYQGGVGHINERLLSHWVELFNQNDFELFDCLRAIFWNDEHISVHYRQNAVLFIKRNCVDVYSKSLVLSRHPIDIVHPNTLESRAKRAQSHLVSIDYFQVKYPKVYDLLRKSNFLRRIIKI